MRRGDELSERRARREARKFLDSLRDNPFVVVTVEDDGMKVYTKACDDWMLDKAREALADIGG